jgi:hypothetical protein
LNFFRSKPPSPASPEATTAATTPAISLYDFWKRASSPTAPLTSPNHSAPRPCLHQAHRPPECHCHPVPSRHR